MTEPMKCENEITPSAWKGDDFASFICGGEMEEKGIINNEGMYEPLATGGKGFLHVQTIYQCTKCKDIKIV